MEETFIRVRTHTYFSGGGNAVNLRMDRGRPPLRWMSYEASSAGLRLATFDKEWVSRSDRLEDRVSESLTPIWWPFEVIPWRRLTYRTPGDTTFRVLVNSELK